MTDEDVGSLLANTLAALLDCGEHGIAGNGPLTIGEAAYRNIVRHLQSHSLGCIHNTYGSVVVDGEKCIWGGVLVVIVQA